MRPPVTTIPGISADWAAIGKSVRAANDPDFRQALVTAVKEREDEGGSATHPETPTTKPPA